MGVNNVAFETVQIAPNIYHMQSGTNIGLIVSGNTAILIDAGLDDDAGRRIKKAIDTLGLNITDLIVTHAHADHFGGAAYLRRNLRQFIVSASKLEAAIVENPQLEGISLSAGAVSFDPLNDKFTFASPCTVDHIVKPGNFLAQNGLDMAEIVPLHGHSPQQIGVLVKQSAVLFCADAILPMATLLKYPIPFTTHIGQAFKTLAYLNDCIQTGTILAPGHGIHLSGEKASEVIDANEVALSRVIDATDTALRSGPLSDADVTFAVARTVGDMLATAVSYYLARATIQASLVYLYEQKRATLNNNGNGQMVWQLT